MSRSDARKREIQDRINTMHEHLELAQMGAWPHPPTDPRDQEPDMTSPTQRRHDELVTLLTEIRDRLPEPECVRDEPVDVTEEPPVGSQVTDREGDVWERREGGWALWWPERSGWLADLDGLGLDPWPVVRVRAPLRPTTDADRKRVGLPVEPDPADVDPDEALAMDLYHASLGLPPASEIDPSAYGDSSVRERFLEMARDTRKMEVIGKAIENAEAERDGWKAKYAALREDVVQEERLRHYGFLRAILDRDDERGRDA